MNIEETMKPDSKLTVDQLASRMSKLLQLANPFVGVGYRSSTPRYANESDLLTGEGSKRHGGRWNPVGIPVVYLSLTPETAMAETFAHYRYYGIPVEDAMPRTFVAVDATLQRIIDLCDGRLRQRLQVSEERILTVDWRKEVYSGRQSLTQRIGVAAQQVGLEGLIVPSAAQSDGHNLLVFPENMLAGSNLTVRNIPRLKP